MTSTNNNTSTSGPVLALTCADTMAGFYVARGALAAKAMAAAAKKPTTKPSSSESSTSPTTIVPGTNWSKVVAIVASRAHPYAVQLARAGAEIRELAAAADGGGGNEDEVLAGIDAVVLVPVPTWAMVEKTRAVVDAIGRSESVRAVVLASCITAEMATTNGAAVAATAAGSEIGTPTAASSSPSGSSSSNNKPTTHPSIPLMYADVEAMVAKLVRTPVRVCIARVGVPNQLLLMVADVMQNRGILALNTGTDGQFAPCDLKDCGMAMQILAHQLLLMHQQQETIEPPKLMLLLTGRDLVTGPKLAEMATRALLDVPPPTAKPSPSSGSGPTIGFQPIDDVEMRQLVASGNPDLGSFEVEQAVHGGALVRMGRLAVRSADLENTIGRAPVSPERFIRDNASSFRPIVGGKLVWSVIRDGGGL